MGRREGWVAMLKNKSNQYSVSTKVALIAASFLLPLAVLVWLMIGGIHSHIVFAEHELLGTRFQRPLFALLTGIQQHQLERVICVSPPCEAVTAVTADIESSLVTLERLQLAHREILQLTPAELKKPGREGATVEALRSSWEDVKASSSAPEFAPESVYQTFIDATRAIMRLVGDRSNLILDPDLDSYYLMDAILLGLVPMQARQGRIAGMGYSALGLASSLTPQQQRDFAVEAAMLAEVDVARVEESVGSALKEDLNFYRPSRSLPSSIVPVLATWKEASNAFIRDLQRLSNGQAIRQQEFLDTARKARVATAAQWNATANELDNLLRIRIKSYESDQHWGLILAALATLEAGILAFLLLRSITLPLQDVLALLTPGVCSLHSCVESIRERSRDHSVSREESELICDELNEQAERLRAAVAALSIHVLGDGPADSTEEKFADLGADALEV